MEKIRDNIRNRRKLKGWEKERGQRVGVGKLAKVEIEGGFIFEKLGNRGREGIAEGGKIGKDKESEE